MILMVSGRTDIIGFYYPWLLNRIKEGYVDTRNPFNEKQVYRYYFKDVDAMMLCTKNPIPLLENPMDLPLILHVTITPYGKDLEPNVPKKMEIIEAIKALSQIYGKNNIVIRYDPIIVNEKYTTTQHGKSFENLVSMLHDYVSHFVISFVDDYKNTRSHNINPLTNSQMNEIGKLFQSTIEKYHVRVQTCAETIDLSDFGIVKGQCLSQEDMANLLGKRYEWEIDDYKREQCRCVQTRDISAYNSCLHMCKYCYANYDEKQIQNNIVKHNPKSSLLIGMLDGSEEIKVVKNKNRQVTLF